MGVHQLFHHFAMMKEESLAMAEQGMVIVDIVRKGDGTYQDGMTRPTDDVKIKTSRGDTVWVPERDIYARKPNPEKPDPA